ncbi:MAG: hypothetical protein IJT31_03620 [Oscillibacter sp.]|nr:hypothetical protein [Oscillibacter sp.]
MKYLVKFRPLEPYTFGTDQTFEYPSEQGHESKTGKESYFVLSGTVPAQTTILGALRYLALKRTEKLLRTDFQYSDSELEEVQETIGPESFQFDADAPQQFGVIHSVSPLFLSRGGRILIRNPFHNRAENNGYRPMCLTGEIWTSHGEISLPAKDEYNAKKGYAGGFIDIESKTVYHDERIFRSVILPGNQKTSDADNRAYYRRQMISLPSDCAFAVYVDAAPDAFPPDSVAYMGQKRAAFRVTATPFAEDEPGTAAEILERQVRAAFADGSEPWFYALSPLWIPSGTAFKSFCIVEETSQRNLTTDYSAPTPIHKLKRSPVRYNLVRAGSVFYGARPAIPPGQNCQTIGYNSVVQLGGDLS